jgi:hypothetical protein
MHEAWRKHAERRQEIHRHQASHRPLSEHYEVVGLAGEVALAAYLGLAVDLSERPAGDGGVDATSPLGSIDVKTARKPYHLLVEQGKVRADFYVLAGYFDDVERADLIGWASRGAILIAPTRNFGYGVTSHYIPATRLKPMKLLAGLYRRLR